MGINYNDSIILYNRYESQTLGAELCFGTRFDNVRVELTQGANIRNSGLENADSCLVKIEKNNLPKPYISPEAWDEKTVDDMPDFFTASEDKDFVVIVKKESLNIDIDLPVGMVNSNDYPKLNFFQWVKDKYGHAYLVHTFDDCESPAPELLPPRFEIFGK